MKFNFVQTGPAGAIIYDHDIKIAEIRDLYLTDVRFQAEEPVVIGDLAPMPLFWRQYHDHQHPERHAGNHAELALIRQEDEAVTFSCTGYNESRSIKSDYLIRVEYAQPYLSYLFHIQAHLSIPGGRRWHIIRNPVHGEVEFCNLWPERSFFPDAGGQKLYQACLLQRGDSVLNIPHHHLETADKRDLAMTRNDRFLWLLEEVNPIVEILSETQVSAGVCAYMWDAHFGLRVTQPGQEQLFLYGPKEFSVEFQIYALNRTMGKALAARAQTVVQPDLTAMPIVIDGLHTFRHTALDFPGQLHRIWPWQHETDAEAFTRFRIDRENGYDDNHSLQIITDQPATSRWLATTLGPAFGQPPFPDNARFRLTGYVKTAQLDGQATLIIRLHQPGQGDLYKPDSYQHFRAEKALSGSSEWQRLEVLTPMISPAPDRLHIVLQQQGRGTSWFDNVLLELIQL